MTNIAVATPAERTPELLGQTVVVIGGSAGIGFETARRARAEGAAVILTGRDPGRLEKAASEMAPATLRSSTPTSPPPWSHFSERSRSRSIT
jgi:threonine dehydrogenase-like Zn-dependent dehydrogenase